MSSSDEAEFAEFFQASTEHRPGALFTGDVPAAVGRNRLDAGSDENGSRRALRLCLDAIVPCARY